jgi:hypothetical protein
MNSPVTMFMSTAGAMLLFSFVVAYDREQSAPDSDDAPMLSPSNLARKSAQGGETKPIKRSDSEFSMCSDYSLGMSRSGSLADIVNLSRGVNSLGEFCSGGKIAIEVLKFLGSGIVVCGVCWKLLDLTAPQKKLD